MEATTISCLFNMLLPAFYTYLSLGSYFNHEVVTVEDVGPFFLKLAEEKLECAEHLWKMPNQCSDHALVQDMQKPSQLEWG